MVAIVDPAAQLRVEIGTAAPAGVPRSFMQKHEAAGIGKPDRRSKASQPRSDDVHASRDRSRVHRKPWRNTSQSFSDFDTPTRAAGSRHPERSRAESVSW